MRGLLAILILFCSCQGKPGEENPPVAKADSLLSFDQIIRRNYDVPELKNLKDSSKFIALFTIQKRYNNYIFIEFSEIANGINLCVKQPVVVGTNETYDPVRSLPFNQLCYWYVDQEGERIKAFFQQYDSGKVVKEIKCESCFDPEVWTLEIYNHGRYSSVTKDAYGKYEPFIDSLFTKVHLTKENNFRITF